MTRKVVFLVYPGFQLLGLSGPVCAFQIAKEGGFKRAYDIDVVSATGGEVVCSAGVRVATTTPSKGPLDTLVVVGGNAIWDDEIVDSVTPVLTRLARQSRRVASICTGAFALAHAGLLDGREGTTHWRRIPRFRENYPNVKIVTDRLYTHDGQIWTSAGISAGIDLALALIEEDLGTADMRLLAQELVVRRRGLDNQTPLSDGLDFDVKSERIRRVLAYAQKHLAQPLSVNVLADVACISERQLSRAFRKETGLTIAKAIERLRADAARSRIEATVEPIEMISQACGFGDPERMRRAFVRLFGMPPQSLRKAR